MENIVLNNDTSQNLWTYSFQMDKELGNTIELNTANKFLDKNIKITVIEPEQQEQTDASGFDLSISNVSGNSEVTIGTLSGGYYPITANNLSITGTLSASTAGWFSTSGIQTDSDVDNASIGKIAAGSYSASIGSHSISTIPVVQGKLSGTITNIGTTTKPSGTDGTDYWTITPSGEVTTTGISTASGKAIINTAGYIPTGDKSSSSDTKNIVPSINNGTARYIPKAIYSTSAGVTTITTGGYLPTNTKVTNIATISPSTSYSNIGMSNYFTTGTSNDYSVIITPNYTNNAGYVEAHNVQNNGGIGYWKIKTTSLTAGNGNLVLTKGNGEATLEVETGDSASSNNTSLDMKTTTPSSGVYYTLTATGKGTVSGVGKGTVNVGTGWITSTSIESSENSDSETSYEDIVHRYILKSVHGNVVSGALPSSLTRTSGTYQDIEIQPKGYIKIPKGYNPIDKYIFANIADELSEARPASGYSLSISSISGSDTVTIGAYNNGYYPVTANNLSITGTLSASTAGWFSSGEGTDSDTDSVTVGKIGAAILNSQGTVTTAPSVTISGTTNMSTASSGTYYFTRTGTVSNGTVQTTYKVTTAGYTPTRNTTNGEPITVTPTKTADTTIYIPTAIGTVDMVPGNGSCAYDSSSSQNVTISETNTSGVKVTFIGSGSVSAIAETTAGYTPVNTSFAIGSSTSSNSRLATIYISGVTLTNKTEFSITVPGNITFHFAVDKNGNTTIT